MTVRPDIAIVGLGCLFPGATDADRFWDLICRGGCAAGPPPAGRWPDAAESFCQDRLAPDRIVSARAGFVDPLPSCNALDLPGFDTAGLDPLFQLLLHAGHQAWLDAVTGSLDRGRCGVFLGNIVLPSEAVSNWSDALLARATEAAWGQTPAPEPDFNPLNRHVAGLPAGLLAASLDLGGGATCLDAACASSLYAIKLAADELREGRRDAMLAGGLSRPDSLYTQMGFTHLHALSATGHCRPFSRDADGLLVGEGAGMVVLKRLDDALECGDHIYATLPGIGLSNDIGGNLMHPDSAGQLRAMRQAYAQAGWRPGDVDLIECHGTGTPAGDRIELSSLQQLWSDEHSGEAGGCVIGSVKSNIGHLLTAAGIAGLIKVLLALRAGRLPPTANVDRVLEDLRDPHCPFRILSQAQTWQRRGHGIPRRAAVSAFGFGGINAHVLVQEWDPQAGACRATRALHPSAAPPATPEPVAVVGLAGQFGSWKDPAALSARLLGDSRVDCMPGPGRRLGLAGDELPQGYPLDGISVDSLRFRIPPRELEQLLPQQALMLQSAADALDDAGITTDHGAHLSSGIYIGIELDLNTCNFHWRWQAHRQLHNWQQGPELLEDLRETAIPYLNADRTMGALGGIVASRIARWLGAGAGSFTVSCEQASALKALEIAMRALRNEEINLALVGGVDLNAEPRALRAQQQLHALEHFGEGAGAVVLKRHSDAIRDGDRIYCLLRGISQRSAGRQSPAAAAGHCRLALAEALADAGLKTLQPGLVEMSGDAERGHAALQVLTSELNAGSGDPRAVSFSNNVVGDSGAACGIVSLLRVALCLHYRVLPAASSPAGQDPRALTDGFYRPAQSHYWLRNRSAGPRQALLCVNSDIGGNLQLIAEGVTNLARPPLVPADTVLCIHGRDSGALIEAIEQCRQQIQNPPHNPLAAIADHWHQHNRCEPGMRTVSLVAQSEEQCLGLLDQARDCVAADRRATAGRLFYEPEPLATDPARLAYVFPGSGNHYPAMTRQLSLPMAAVLDSNDARYHYLLDQFAGGAFWRDTPVAAHDHTRLLCSQIWCSTFVHDIFQHLGVRAGAMIGYSLGETASLFASGCWPDRDAMLARIRDTELFQRDLGPGFAAVRQHWGLAETDPVDWRMAMIQAPLERVREALSGAFAGERIYLLIINTANECVLGGDGASLARFAAHLEVILHPVHGVTTVHCEVARPVAAAYRELHLQTTRAVAGIAHYSCHLGRPYPVTRESAADSILAMALEPFDFRRLIETAYADGVRVFLETGPGDACTRMIDTILGDQPHLAVSACHSRAPEYSSLLLALAAVAAHGVAVDTAAWQQHRPAPDRRRAPRQVLNLAPGLSSWTPPQPVSRDPGLAATDPGSSMPPPAVSALAAPPGAWPVPVTQGLAAVLESRHQAHAAYLHLQSSIEHSLTEILQLRQAAAGSVAFEPPRQSLTGSQPAAIEPLPVKTGPVFDRAQCLRFAVAGIAEVLGPEFADIDHHPTRVRLPAEPLMLVDRVLAIEGQPGSLGAGRIITEHDIKPGAWYLDANRIPTCIAVEAGQADLFLCAWLGIDRVTRGKAVYRLLDATITFHDQLPAAGGRIRYDIRINRFFTLGATHLFQFQFDASVDGKPLLSMRDGSAGFFSPAELAAGQGIVGPPTATTRVPGAASSSPAEWLAPPLMPSEQYDQRQLAALRDGDLAACFGDGFKNLPLYQPRTLPAGRLCLVHRVLEIRAPRDGQPGYITGEADIHPEDWFLTCHFIDDPVMPGTLMYECCLHTLRIYLLRMGWTGEQDQVSCQPLPGACGRLKCRGQVTTATCTVQYRITVRETAYLPDGTPYALADALMLAAGQPIVEMQNLSLCLRGLDRENLTALWKRSATVPQPRIATPLFDHAAILAYAEGRPSEGFGDRYRIFDQDRILARLPRPPYLFLDQIEVIEHCQQWQLRAGGEIISSYRIQPRDWYFEANRQQALPLAVLLEIALQPCGWLAAYLGSALTSDTDLSFRNLDGRATLHRPLDQHAGRLQARSRIDKLSNSGGMIIQSYSVSVEDAVGCCFECVTVFGFFSKSALAQQVGIRDATWYAVENITTSPSKQLPFPVRPPFPGKAFRMLDSLSVLSLTGGRHGLGWVEGQAPVDHKAWYFEAHFYQDPVIPGSLGIESMVQLLKAYALERWSQFKTSESPESLFQSPAPGIEMRWSYRGQVIPANRQVSVQVHVARVDSAHSTLIADGYLAVDGRIIYSVENLSLGLRGGT